MLKFIIVFTLCSLVNVMFNTVKTIIMYRNEKLSSALINAVTYGFYTIVVVLMAGDMALWLKVIITAVTNFIGVWLSMLILEKLRKDKLWCIDCTVKAEHTVELSINLTNCDIPFSVITIDNGKYNLFKIYCNTQADSTNVKGLLNLYNAKYFVNESKTL